MSENYFIENKETGKIELHFDKEKYMSLSNDDKSTIKSNFLFSRRSAAWVSRCKFPHLYRPREIALNLGLEDKGTTGERLSFEDQENRRIEKAERRADRYEYKAEKAEQRAEQLQAPINRMHGDIAFFTQPNINTSAGRAFTNKRNRMPGQSPSRRRARRAGSGRGRPVPRAGCPRPRRGRFCGPSG